MWEHFEYGKSGNTQLETNGNGINHIMGKVKIGVKLPKKEGTSADGKNN